MSDDLDFGDSDMVDDLLANCNQLRERCWKAEDEVKRLREHAASEERIMQSADRIMKTKHDQDLAAKDAEICILKTEACAAQKNIKRMDDDITGLMKELARWQEIAKEERTNLLMLKEAQSGTNLLTRKIAIVANKEKYREQAAKELSIQISQVDDDLTIAYMLGSKTANERLKVLQEYVERLEAAYLTAEKDRRHHLNAGWRDDEEPEMTWEQAEEEAQAALEKIRKCHP